MKLKYENVSDKSSVEKPIKEKKSEAEDEEGPLNSDKSKCTRCTFETQNRVLISEHTEKYHGVFVSDFIQNS